MPVKPVEIEAARKFFAPHIPRFAKALAQHHPELFVALHGAVQEGTVTIAQLRKIGAHYLELPPAEQQDFREKLDRAEKYVETPSAVRIMLLEVEGAKKAKQLKPPAKAAAQPVAKQPAKPTQTIALPAGKRIVVKFSDLHPDIRAMINELKKWRKLILKEAGKSAAIGGGAGTGLPLATDLIVGPGINIPTSFYLATAAVGLGGLGLLSYKSISPDVRQATRDVGSYLRTKSIDAAGKLKAREIRKTHPFAIVNRKGDVVLIPNTRFQKAVAKAQETFLKHVLPGRYRVKI